MGGVTWSTPGTGVPDTPPEQLRLELDTPSEDDTSGEVPKLQQNMEHKEVGHDEVEFSIQRNEVERADNDEEEVGDRRTRLQEELDEFRDNLEKKKEQRKQTMSRISEEMNSLRECKEELEKERALRIGLEKQVTALKEVSKVSNEMLQLREIQVNDLKRKLNDAESSSTENLTELKKQYQKQIENVQKLRQLYEERTDAIIRGHESQMEKERAKNTLLELKLADLENQSPEIEKLTKKVSELEEELERKEEEKEKIKDLQKSSAAECRNLASQLTLINNLFSNMLTGNELDFDLLTELLQDNHNLITDLIANGDMNETAAVLFNIAEKVYKKSEGDTTTTVCETEEEREVSRDIKDEIASNLPKVWRVLIELLSRHEDCSHAVVQGTSEECYKNVQTPYGSRTVISVSQTFLRLKDLILEKNRLVKEVSKLKTLNGHLENRLDTQERRLGTVCLELRKTWGVVSKLKVQHRQLHTHERILRYELQHKRQVLTGLKHDLKYCRETWDRAREKNTQTEHDWEVLRKEFAARKKRQTSNSAESGYEDDEASQSSQSPDLSNSDSEYEVSEDSPQSTEDIDDDDAPSLDLEDAASDATVIELIDMLELDNEELQSAVVSQPFQNVSSSPTLELVEENFVLDSTNTNDNIDTTDNPVAAIDDTSRSFSENRSPLILEPLVNNITNREMVTNIIESLHAVTNDDNILSPLEETNFPVVQEENSNRDISDCDPTCAEIIDNGTIDNSQSGPCIEESAGPSETTQQPRSAQEILDARSERLRRLEMQCCSLLNQMSLTSLRSDTLSTRLEELHEQYGSEDRNRRRLQRCNATDDITVQEAEDVSLVSNDINHAGEDEVIRDIRDTVTQEIALEEAREVVEEQPVESVVEMPVEVKEILTCEICTVEPVVASTSVLDDPESKLKERAVRIQKMEEACLKFFQKQKARSDSQESASNTHLEDRSMTTGSTTTGDVNVEQDLVQNDLSPTNPVAETVEEERGLEVSSSSNSEVQGQSDANNDPKTFG